MDAIRASWRAAQGLQPAIAAHDRQLAERQRGSPAVELVGPTASPAIAAVTSPERGTSSSAFQHSDHGSSDNLAQAQEIAELHRRQELLLRDIELRLDLACDTVRDAPLPPVLEFEYGDDGRAYAVEPAQRSAVGLEPPAIVLAPAAQEADAPQPSASEHSDVAREADEPRAPEPAPPEPRAPVLAALPAKAQHAFAAHERHPSPGSRLDDTV